MPTDVLPETSPVTVDIQTGGAGLSAPEVKSLVTTPLEKNLLEGVLDATDATSDSIESLSDIELHFAPVIPVRSSSVVACSAFPPRVGG